MTINSSSNLKIPKKGSLSYKLKVLLNMKLGTLTNLKVQISSMTIMFFKFWPKSTQMMHIWPHIFLF